MAYFPPVRIRILLKPVLSEPESTKPKMKRGFGIVPISLPDCPERLSGQSHHCLLTDCRQIYDPSFRNLGSAVSMDHFRNTLLQTAIFRNRIRRFPGGGPYFAADSP